MLNASQVNVNKIHLQRRYMYIYFIQKSAEYISYLSLANAIGHVVRWFTNLIQIKETISNT